MKQMENRSFLTVLINHSLNSRALDLGLDLNDFQ